MSTQNNDDLRRVLSLTHGLEVNENNRVYQRGTALPIDQKVEIAVQYLQAVENATGGRPNIAQLARECKVSRSMITKVEEELVKYNRVRDPKEIRENRDVPSGPGAVSLDEFDVFVLLMLHNDKPYRTLKDYRKRLYEFTGTLVHESTISRIFNHGFDIKGTLCKTNMIPYDKFRPENLERAIEYLLMISVFNRSRIKFGDEKHLKGAELWCRKTRRNVITGEIPPMLTHPDFRNTYSIVGMCGIDPSSTPLFYSISEGTNDAQNFAEHIELAILSRFLQPGDVLVLDNAAIHTGGENTILEGWLWENFRIFILLLPARTPEWNPIELVWNILVQRLAIFSLEVSNDMGKHSLVQASALILNNITHAEVDGCFRKCGV